MKLVSSKLHGAQQFGNDLQVDSMCLLSGYRQKTWGRKQHLRTNGKTSQNPRH